MADVTVQGGASYATSLTPAQAALADGFLQNINASNVDYVIGGGEYILNQDNAAIILSDTNPNDDSLLTAFGSGDVLIGNQGNDKFRLTEYGSVVGGDGDDTVRSTYSGPNWSAVDLGDGTDKVHFDGNASVSVGTGNDTIYVRGMGDISVGGGADKIVLGGGGSITDTSAKGNDTIRIGTGDYSINEAGVAVINGQHMHATVTGGSLTITDSGGVETVVAGAGYVAVDAGANQYLQSGSGTDVFNLRGAGNDTFVGGAGGSATVSLHNAGTNDLFEFSNNNSNDVIMHFAHGDYIELAGLTAQQAFADAQVIQGIGTVITDGTTTITLKGFYDIQLSDFKNG